LTFFAVVVLVIATPPLSTGSSGRWLLKIWLEPGTRLESNFRFT